MQFEKLHKSGQRRGRQGAAALFLALAVLQGYAATVQEIKPRKSSTAQSQSEKLPPVPEITGARRIDLPEVFRKPVPTTIEDLKNFQARTEELVKKVSKAVVAVELRGGTGSGVVISKDGLVLTAGHVCGEPFLDVTIRFPDGTTAKGKTLGTDHDMDSGLVRITDKGDWPHAEVGDLFLARAGDWVLALGHPGGFDKDRTTVARLGRILRVRNEVLQTDCTLIGGDSGGPLFDMYGRVIGIHSRISNATTQNYHVPIDTFIDTWPRLAGGESWGEEEPPTLSWTGVRCADRPEGCRIERIEEESPAVDAKLKVGDIVKTVNGHEVNDYMSFLTQLGEARRGTDVELKIKREGKELDVTVKFPTELFRRPGRSNR